MNWWYRLFLIGALHIPYGLIAQLPCEQLDSAYVMFLRTSPSRPLSFDLFGLANNCPTYPIDKLHKIFRWQANGYYQEREHDQSISYLHESLSFLKNRKDYHETLSIELYALLGANYRMANRPDSTGHYYDLVYELYNSFEEKKKDPYYCIFLRGYAAHYYHWYRYNEADRFFKECLSCHEALKADSSNYSTSLRVFGEYLATKDQIDSAEYYIYRAIEMNDALLEPSIFNKIYELKRLRTLAESKGNREIVEFLVKDEYDLYKSYYGGNHKEMYLTEVVLRKIELLDQAHDPYAYKNYLDSLNNQQLNHTAYVKGLYNLGLYYYAEHQFSKALDYLNKADADMQIIYKEIESKKNNLKHAISLAYQRNGDNKNAAIALEDYYKPILETHPSDHSKVGSYHHRKAQIQFLEKEYAEASRNAQIGANIQQKHLTSFASFCSEYELEKVTLKYLDDIKIHCNMAWQKPKSEDGFAGISFNDALFMKGFLLNNNQKLRNEMTNHPEAFRLQQQLLAIKLAQTKKAIGQEVPKDSLDTLMNIQEKLEKNLARMLRSGKILGVSTTWEDIEKELNKEEVAIEIVQFNKTDATFGSTDSVVYAALILRKGVAPLCIPLCKELDLQKVLEEPIDKIYSTRSQLYKLIWQPIEAELKGIKTIWLSPSGILHHVIFNAIIHPNGQLIGRSYHIHTVASTRHILEKAEKEGNALHSSAVLFGGLDYETSTLDSRTSDKIVVYNAPSPSLSDRNELRGRLWTALKWTQAEIDSIGNLLHQSGFHTTKFQESFGTEKTFKAMGQGEPSPFILHLSTHGYFFPEPSKQNEQVDESVWVRSENPLIRSGLILSGGNLAWTQKASLVPGAEDGILTALEISQMDLSHTHLVVLSACETGLGDIKGSEGVYGLQRAFQIAGAKNIVMSMWQVPDWHTKELMIRFYHYWLQEKLPISLALQQAQLSMRDEGYEPFYWAGFVVLE